MDSLYLRTGKIEVRVTIRELKYIRLTKTSNFIQYLVDTALSLVFRDSENDWSSDGPALSWLLGED